MREEDRQREPVSGKELMREARARLRERVAILPVRREVPAAPPGPLPLFEPVPVDNGVILPTGRQVLQVPCPACKAAIGMSCFIPAAPTLRPNGGTHPSRRTAALGLVS